MGGLNSEASIALTDVQKIETPRLRGFLLSDGGLRHAIFSGQNHRPGSCPTSSVSGSGPVQRANFQIEGNREERDEN